MLFRFPKLTVLRQFPQKAQLMPAVMPEDGQFLLFFPERGRVIVQDIQLTLEPEVLFLHLEHGLGLPKPSLKRPDQQQSHTHQHPQGNQDIQLEKRMEQNLRIQDEIALIGMVVAQQERNGPQPGPESRLGGCKLFPGKQFSQYLQDQGHPQQEQPQIQREIGQDPVGMPGLRQEQFEDFQTQGMDKDHVNGLEPQYEQMPEPERPDGEHQQQQIGQIAEIIQELEGAGFKFHEPPAKKTGQQDKFEQENVQMPAQQEMAGGRPYNGPERVIAEIGRRQQGHAEQEQGQQDLGHSRSTSGTVYFSLCRILGKMSNAKKPATKVTGLYGIWSY